MSGLPHRNALSSMDDVPVEQHAHWDAAYERKPES